MSDSCYCGPSPGRGFWTDKEKIEMLQEYKNQLDMESQGVAERIKELMKNGETR